MSGISVGDRRLERLRGSGSEVRRMRCLCGVVGTAIFGDACSLPLSRTSGLSSILPAPSGRRWKGLLIGMTESFVQLLNLSMYLLPNAYHLETYPDWNGTVLTWCSFLRLSCWNTIFLMFMIMAHNTNLVKTEEKETMSPRTRMRSDGKIERRSDEAIFDKPMRYHTPKLVIWGATEVLLVSITIYMLSNDEDDGPNVVVRRLTLVVAFCFLLYFLITGYYFRRGFKSLREKQYLNHRISNIMIRFQFRLQMIVHCFHIVSFGLLWFVKIHTFASFSLSWLGFLPSQFVMTMVDTVKCYLYIPIKPAQEDLCLQTWLREEFAWSEDQLPEIMKKKRCGSNDGTASTFCFERALKTVYWSSFVYDFKQVLDSKYSLKTAMQMYGLINYELFHEHLHDTKLMVAWNSETILLTFRGTSSLKNLFADLRIARIPHPPIRGGWLSCPMVHRGFLQTWHSNGLNLRVLELIRSLIKDKKDVSVLLTGHSLGGALATLAALDIHTELHVPSSSISCYTFGAPRVGNYAFAHEYNTLVPDTWHIINDQDYITRTMKLINLYKRPGQRVIINTEGDMLVRPSFIEMSLAKTTGAVNIMHHLLGSYEASFLAIVRMQFSEDSIEGGYEGMLQIGDTIRQVLGVSRTRLIQELNWGDRIKALEKRKKRESSRWIGAAENFTQSLRELMIDAGTKIESLHKCLRQPTTYSIKHDLDRNTMRLCEGSMGDVMELQLTEVDGICTESGRVSLHERRGSSDGREGDGVEGGG